MISYLSNKIALILHNNDEEQLIDIEVYRYGLELLISTLINLLIMMTIAGYLRCLKEMALYFAFFSSLRVFAGGYHASTHIKCILIYTSTALMIIWMITIASSNGYSIFIVALAYTTATVLILKYAPVDTANKPLSAKECQLFRQRSKQVLTVQSIVLLILLLLHGGTTRYLLCCVSGMLAESITLIPMLNHQRRKKS